MPFSSNGVPGGLAEGPLISSMGSEASSVGLEVSSVGLGNMCSGTGSMVISWRMAYSVGMPLVASSTWESSVVCSSTTSPCGLMTRNLSRTLLMEPMQTTSSKQHVSGLTWMGLCQAIKNTFIGKARKWQ